MGDLIVIQFSTLDGVVSDPDGRGGTKHGGWAFRYGPGPVTGDKFRLGERMEAQLYGRRTWQHFAQLWPGRDTDYAQVMNAVPKYVATRTGIDASAWSNSSAIDGDPVEWVSSQKAQRSVVVIGSLSLVHALAAVDLIDEYRLITFPVAVGEGSRLFASVGVPMSFDFTEVDRADNAVLTVLRRTERHDQSVRSRAVTRRLPDPAGS